MKYKEDVKIKINDNDHCIQVQNKLFEMGYRWYTSGKTITNEFARWIFLYKDGSLFYSTNPEYSNDGKEEVFLDGNHYEIY